MVFQQKIREFRDREIAALHPGQDVYKPAIWFIYFLVCMIIIIFEAMGMQFVWNNYLTIIVPNLINFDYMQILTFKIFFEIFR